MPPSVFVLLISIKSFCLFTNKAYTQKELTQVWEHHPPEVKGWASKHSPSFLWCIFISVGTWSLAREPAGTVQRAKEQQPSRNTERWQRLTACRLRALCGGLLPSATHWASSEVCLPWPSSSCFGLAGPCHAPLFAHWWSTILFSCDRQQNCSGWKLNQAPLLSLTQ